MDELETASSTTNDAPLSMSEAVKALTAPEPDEEAETGQSEAETAQEGDADEELPPDEGGEDDEGNADEEQAEGDEEGAPESDQGRFVSDTGKVRLDDGTVTSIADLKKGTLLHADYTRKTQEVAEQRRSVESQSSANQAHQQQIQERADFVEGLIRSIIPEPPDYALADPNSPKYDPVKYQADEALHRAWQQHLGTLEQQKQRDQQARQAEQQQRVQDVAAREWNALLEKVPAFKDEAKVKAFADDLKKFGPTYGLSPQDIQAVALDHRYAIILRKAITHDKLQASKAKTPPPKVDGRPPVMKGGTRLNPKAGRAREANAAMERLNQTGSLRDGVAAYLATQK